MGREINFDSILALDKQIEEHERALIQLKRTRNSFLNVSTFLPPEILGRIFRCNAMSGEEFVGVPKGSYNFLLVCHHWFEVASRTPELWRFWGISIQDWEHRHPRCWASPLDLVLTKDTGHDLDDTLRDALQDRVARDVIRRAYLWNANTNLLNSVTSAMVTGREGSRLDRVESFEVRNSGGSIVDVSAFLSRYHLPKLQTLYLYGCGIPSWEVLKSQTAALTILDLTIPEPPHGFTPNVADSRIPLHHLKDLSLAGEFHSAFGFLNKLEYPDKMDLLTLRLDYCSPLDLLQTLGPFFGNHIRRRGRLPGRGLGLSAYYEPSSGVFGFGDFHKHGDPAEVGWFMDVTFSMVEELEDEEAYGLCFDLVAHIPQAQVISLTTDLPVLRSKLCVDMRGLEHLHIFGADLSTWPIELEIHGPQPEDLLRNLDRIEITVPMASGGWGAFADFLSRRAAVGNRISLLRFDGHTSLRIDEAVIVCIERAVGVFDNLCHNF